MSETSTALSKIKLGLTGYVSYLEACNMQKSFSEYVLYEPILRILKTLGYEVECEYPCPGIIQPKNGDKKKLDFYAKKEKSEIAIEVKWIKSKNCDFSNDIEKLRAFKKCNPKLRPVICIFGKNKIIQSLDFERIGWHRVRGGKTHFERKDYACLVLQLK